MTLESRRDHVPTRRGAAASERVRSFVLKTFRVAPFETVVVVAAVLYACLRLSPSSYAIGLGYLGEDVSPWLGAPRDIRSDEWAVYTPLFQATVNNGFRETNETSFWSETLLGFLGLPLLTWGTVFKPLVWAFFVLPPSFAYSIYWAATAGLMLIGWSLLLRAIGFRKTTAALLSGLIFFSPFVQAWWTALAPQFAFFPWIVFAVLKIKSPVRLAAVLALGIPVWMLGFFYPPGVFPMVFLGGVLCLVFAPRVVTVGRVVAIVTGGLVGVALTYLHFRPVVEAYADSHYPGHRWAHGGNMMNWQALSQLLPGTTTEWYGTMIATTNVCEISTVASWLPLLALCVVDFRTSARRYRSDPGVRRDVRRIAALGAAWFVITAWQVTPYLVPLSYLLGWGFSPEVRTLFASGVLLVLAAGYAVERLPIRATGVRLGVFAVLVVLSWLLASWRLPIAGEGFELRDELLVLVPVAVAVFLVLTRHGWSDFRWRVATLLIALVPTLLVWGTFNPVQTTTVMFEKPDTETTQSLDALAHERPDGAIAAPGYFGAVLNGVGYRSVSHMIATPSPHLFHKYFPTMSEEDFDLFFNRHTLISLTDGPEPVFIAGNNVAIPIETMRPYAATP